MGILCYDKHIEGAADRRLARVQIKNNRNRGWGGYFFVILITRVTIAIITRVYWKSSAYVTMLSPPFSRLGANRLPFYGSTFIEITITEI